MGTIHLLRRNDHVGNINSPSAVVGWIIRNVPSFIRRVPEEWTDEIFESLATQGVSDHVIKESFKMARIHGYDFGDVEIVRMFGRVTWVYKAVYVEERNVPIPSAGQAEPMTLGDAKKLAAMYEDKYNIAQVNDDYEAQASLIKNFWNLVRNFLASVALGRGMKPGQDSPEEKRRRAGEQLRLPAAGETSGGGGVTSGGGGVTSGGGGVTSGGGGGTEATNRTVEQLRPSAPQVTKDATALARMGVRNPTARDVETKIAPSRPPGRRGGRSGNGRNTR